MSSYSTQIATDGATYHWKLIETSGTNAADSIGSNTGTYTGTVTLNQSSAIVTAVGSPAICWPLKTFLNTQAHNLQSRIPLSVGAIDLVTPASGSGGGSGGGTGDGGKGGCFSPNTCVKTQRGDLPFNELTLSDSVLTAKGTWRPIKKLLVHEWPSRLMLHMGNDELVTVIHPISNCDGWSPAIEFGWETVGYVGDVHNLEVEADEPVELSCSPVTERSYTLSNGQIVHNGGIPVK